MLPARKKGTQHVIEERDLRAVLGGGMLPMPRWMKVTGTGEPMPDVMAVLRRQRAGH